MEGSGKILARGARAATLLTALAILYVRTPNTFFAPQLWGEDADFLHGALTNGWSSLTTPMAGYFVVAQSLIATMAAYWRVGLAAAIYSYASIFVTLVIVSIISSPRLQAPSRYVLAIAVVVVPMGNEELGILANLQWILPIGVIALLFTRPSKSRIVLANEISFTAITAVSGPFSLFLAPIAILRAACSSSLGQRRLAILAAVTCLGAIIQMAAIAINASPVTDLPSVPYDWKLWIDMPIAKFATSFGFLEDRSRGVGPAIGLAILALLVFLSFQRPYRQLKFAILFFSLSIAAAGMFKFRSDLSSQWAAQRYFYPGCVFVLWFVCCIGRDRWQRITAAFAVMLLEMSLLPDIANTSKMSDDVDLAVWSGNAEQGFAVIMPTHPPGWFAHIPSSKTGEGAHLQSWLGRDLMVVARDAKLRCDGQIDLIEPAVILNYEFQKIALPLLKTGGRIDNWARDRDFVAVALVNQDNTVVGFGFPGFEREAEQKHPRWKAYFGARAGSIIAAYGIFPDHSVCAISGERHISSKVQALSSEKYMGPVPIQPGVSLVQSFKPKKRVEGLALQFVAFGRKPQEQGIHWKIRAFTDDETTDLGSGTIDGASVQDWGYINLPLVVVSKTTPDRIELTIETDAEMNTARLLGVPLFAANDQVQSWPATIGGEATPSSGQLNMKIYYVD